MESIQTDDRRVWNQETELVLKLNDREIELLRNSTSDLGLSEPFSISLQLKIANSILDGRINAKFEAISAARQKGTS